MNSDPSPKRKMSEMISEMAAGFIGVGKTAEEKQSRLTAACSAWNMACGSPELRRLTQLSRNLKKKFEQAGEGTQIVPVTWNELHKLNDETGQAAVYAPSADKKRLMAVMSGVVKFFEEEHAEVFGLEAPTPRKRRPAKSDLLFQFKIDGV